MSECICDQCETEEESCPANQAMEEISVLRRRLEQQAKQIKELEKYGELGRLALKANMEDPVFDCDSKYREPFECTKLSCEWKQFCKLRAELLAEEGNES